MRDKFLSLHQNILYFVSLWVRTKGYSINLTIVLLIQKVYEFDSVWMNYMYSSD